LKAQVSFFSGKADQLFQDNLMEKQKLNTSISHLESQVEKEIAIKREKELALKEIELCHQDFYKQYEFTNDELRLSYQKLDQHKSYNQKIIKEHESFKEKSSKELESLQTTILELRSSLNDKNNL